MRSGYWKFHRKIWENPVFRGHPDRVAIWCWMLSEAAWSEGKSVMFHGKRVDLLPGQFSCGSYQISHETGVSRSSVVRILKCFAIEQQIEQLTDFHISLITVKKWKEYQQDEQQIEKPSNSYRTAIEQLVNTTEEGKKGRREEIGISNTATLQVADDVQKVLSEFYSKLNPTLNFGNKTQRQAAQDLISKIGIEKVLGAIEFIAASKDDAFAPIITTPYQLKEKFAQLVSYYNKKSNKQTAETKGIRL